MTKIEFEDVYGYVKINGKYYEFDRKDGKVFPKLVLKKKFDAKLKRVEKVADKLKESVDAKKILVEALMKNLDDKAFDKIEKMVFHKKIKYKPKTRAGHCVDLKVGRMIIPMVN